jgi:rhodanese-related sulfurtransferase
MSPKAAGLAVKMGYTQVKVYLQGDPGWQESGRVLTASDAFILDGNIILIDLRAPEMAEKGHIPGAVNIPFDQLEDSWEQFPSFARAPIIFYGEGDQAEKAVEMLRTWGYLNLSVVAGGFERWIKEGFPFTEGAPATEVDWVRTLEEGEIALEDFRKALEAQPADTLILDVRGPAEVAEGMLPGARNIPLDQLESRMSELPKDKKILVYCSTGARASMAREVLAKAGFDARFVTATLRCSDGECSVDQ